MGSDADEWASEDELLFGAPLQRCVTPLPPAPTTLPAFAEDPVGDEPASEAPVAKVSMTLDEARAREALREAEKYSQYKFLCRDITKLPTVRACLRAAAALRGR